MPRQPRIISESGMYHIIFRGADKQNIFREECDYQKLKNIIMKVKHDSNIAIYAYCFMRNHVHLFLAEQEAGSIPNAMRKILTSYAVWYNKKYNRTGPLTEGRYKSYPVEDDEYALMLVRYIHRNPVRAHITTDVSKYVYSSYNDYVLDNRSFVDINFIFEIISDDISVAKKEFQDYHRGVDDEDDITFDYKKSYLIGEIQKVTGLKNIKEISILPKDKRDEMIYKIVNEIKISKSHLSELTGITRYIITKIINDFQFRVRP